MRVSETDPGAVTEHTHAAVGQARPRPRCHHGQHHEHPEDFESRSRSCSASGQWDAESGRTWSPSLPRFSGLSRVPGPLPREHPPGRGAHAQQRAPGFQDGKSPPGSPLACPLHPTLLSVLELIFFFFNLRLFILKVKVRFCHFTRISEDVGLL